VYARSDPGTQEVTGEPIGEWQYFNHMKDDEYKIAYNVYMRIRTEELYKPTTEKERL